MPNMFVSFAEVLLHLIHSILEDFFPIEKFKHNDSRIFLNNLEMLSFTDLSVWNSVVVDTEFLCIFFFFFLILMAQQLQCF